MTMVGHDTDRIVKRKIDEARRSGAIHLSLSGIGFTDAPKLLGELTQLQTLDLSCNELTALPESLGQLTQLQSLNLGYNGLTVVPKLLEHLTRLELLDL